MMHRFGLRLGMAAVLLTMMVSAAFAAGEELFGYVPSGTEYLVYVDATRLRSLPFFRNLTGSGGENAREVLEDFERGYNIRLEDCDALFFAGGGRNLRGVVGMTEVPEKDLRSRLAAVSGGAGKYSLEMEEGRVLHCVNPASSLELPLEQIALTYLKPKVFLASERRYIAPFLKALNAPEPARRAAVGLPKGEPLAWGFFDVASMLSGKKKNNFFGMFLKMVKNIQLELNASGAGRSWRLDGAALCRDANGATQFAMAVPGLLQLAAGWVFIDDAALGQEFLRSVKVYPEGDRVILELEVPEALATRLGSYLEKQAKKRLLPPDPVPAGVGGVSGEGVRRD